MTDNEDILKEMFVTALANSCDEKAISNFYKRACRFEKGHDVLEETTHEFRKIIVLLDGERFFQ